MTEVYDMFFETELSEKLNSELESAGISVSEALITKTLAAVQAARTMEESEAADTEWVEAREENIDKLIELAGTRKRRWKGAAPVLFRAATVMAACFVLVVGALALRFSTMRMGKDNVAPMATNESGSARNGIQYAADADDVGTEDFNYFSDAVESTSEQSAVTSKGAAEAQMDAIAPASESFLKDDADVAEECEKAETSDGTEEVKLLTEQLARAESVRLCRNEQGIRMYEFFVRDSAGVPGYYWVYEDGAVKFAEVLPAGQTGTMKTFGGSENKEFRRAVLVWLKEHGYSF